MLIQVSRDHLYRSYLEQLKLVYTLHPGPLTGRALVGLKKKRQRTHMLGCAPGIRKPDRLQPPGMDRCQRLPIFGDATPHRAIGGFKLAYCGTCAHPPASGGNRDPVRGRLPKNTADL